MRLVVVVMVVVVVVIREKRATKGEISNHKVGLREGGYRGIDQDTSLHHPIQW
jgi:hypothetical protein